MAARARQRVERGAEPVVALRRRRRGDPVAVEDAVADLEEGARRVVEVARGIVERLVGVVEDRGVAAEERRAGSTDVPPQPATSTSAASARFIRCSP